MRMDMSLIELYNILVHAYKDEELNHLCFYHFREVYDLFAAGMTKTQKITLLIEYCERHGELPTLVKQIQKDRPKLFPADPGLLYSRVLKRIRSLELGIEGEGIELDKKIIPTQGEDKILKDTPIADVFARYSSMLILGDTGTGKTTTLRQLALALTPTGKEENEGQQQRLPIYLELSSWKELFPPDGIEDRVRYEAFLNWIRSELAWYNIPQNEREEWVPNPKETILLLDGLDEVRCNVRAACLEAINAFRKKYGPEGLVVTCREDIYKCLEQQGKCLEVDITVVLQKLKWGQIEANLQANNLQALTTLLKRDLYLRELACLPLIFNVMKQAFPKDETVPLFRAGASPAEQRREVFDRFLKKKIHDRRRQGDIPQEKEGLLRRFFKKKIHDRRHQDDTPEEKERLLRGVRLLAKAMKREDLVKFSPDQMQPSWLLPDPGQEPEDSRYSSYQHLTRSAEHIMTLWIGVMVGVFLWFVFTFFPLSSIHDLGALVVALLLPPSSFVLGNAIENLSTEHQERRPLSSGCPSFGFFLMGTVLGSIGLVLDFMGIEAGFWLFLAIGGVGIIISLFLVTFIIPKEVSGRKEADFEPGLAPGQSLQLSRKIVRRAISVVVISVLVLFAVVWINWLFLLLALLVSSLVVLLHTLRHPVNHRILLALANPLVNKPDPTSPKSLLYFLLPGYPSRQYEHFLERACQYMFLQKKRDVDGTYEFLHPLFRDYFAEMKPEHIAKQVEDKSSSG
jgi:hypothetical protein